MTCTSPKLRVLERTSWVAQHFCKTFFHVASPAKWVAQHFARRRPRKRVAQHFARREPRKMGGATFFTSQAPPNGWHNILHVAGPTKRVAQHFARRMPRKGMQALPPGAFWGPVCFQVAGLAAAFKQCPELSLFEV